MSESLKNRVSNCVISLSVVLAAVGLNSCGPQNAKTQAEQLHQVPRDMTQSFSSVRRRTQSRTQGYGEQKVADSGLEVKDSEFLLIKQSAIGKEFLMSSSLIPQTAAPTSSGLQGRVVYFKKVGHRLFLIESTNGHVISPTLPASLILAEIPIIEGNANALVVDFNAGMKTVFVAGNWWGSDFEGKTYNSDSRATGLPVETSYLDSIQTVGDEKEILEIRQIAQVNTPMTAIHPTFEVRYYFRAYEPNPNYKPRESNGDFDHVGYFETPPSLEQVSGRSKLYYTLRDISKPVTYYVSANTPPEFQDAVKEGILYWNKAFGREVVRAEVAPAGVTAPDPTRNLIQWVEYDNAGFAYADALMDPRSGEIKHAQVYLTSAFAFAGKVRARRLLRLLSTEAAQEAKAKDANKDASSKRMYLPVSIKGMNPAALCDYDKSAGLTSLLETVLSTTVDDAGISDAAILRASQDYIREVTAHEVGHTLGLRHNFAGSLGSTYSQKQKADVAKEYLTRGKLENVETSMTTSSIMEYTDFIDSVIDGALLKARKTAMTYDVKAIQYAYINDKTVLNDGTLFCTDSHAGRYLDCAQFDSGKNPLEFIASSISDVMNRDAYAFVEAFLAAKSNVAAVDRVPVEQVVVDPASGSTIGILTGLALNWLNASKRAISVDRKFERIDDLNKDEILLAQLNYVRSLVKELGGDTSATFLTAFNTLAMGADGDQVKAHSYRVPERFQEDFLKKVDAYLNRSDVRKFVGLDGNTYELTTEEVDYIKAYAKKYAEKFAQNMNISVMNNLKRATLDLEVKALKYNLPDGAMTNDLESRIAAVARHIVTTVGGTETLKYKTAQFVIPNFAYTQEERLAAAQALNATQAPLPQWNEEARNSVKNSVTSTLSHAINVDNIWKIDPSTYDGNRPFQIWMQKQRAINNALFIE